MTNPESLFKALEFAILAERFGEAEGILAEYGAAAEASGSLETAEEAREKLALLRHLACAGRAHLALRLMRAEGAASYRRKAPPAARTLSVEA